MTHLHYGIYLIPPPQVIYQVGLMHHLLQSEFNAKIAGKFMVHCTLKGFFKPKDGTSYHDFVGELDQLFSTIKPVTIEIVDLYKTRTEERASATLTMVANEPLVKLYNDILMIVKDYIAPDCEFSVGDLKGNPFLPHITFAQYDLPTEPGLFEQAIEFCQYMFDKHLKGQFEGHNIQLNEFYADDWAGNWGDSMHYKQLKGWTLKG